MIWPLPTLQIFSFPQLTLHGFGPSLILGLQAWFVVLISLYLLMFFGCASILLEWVQAFKFSSRKIKDLNYCCLECWFAALSQDFETGACWSFNISRCRFRKIPNRSALIHQMQFYRFLVSSFLMVVSLSCLKFFALKKVRYHSIKVSICKGMN